MSWCHSFSGMLSTTGIRRSPMWQRYFSLHITLHCCCSCLVAKLCSTLCDPMDGSTPGFPVLYYLLEFSQIHVHEWCYLTISSSATSFSSFTQSFPTSGSFPMSWLFPSGSQSIGTLTSVLPMNNQGWFLLGLTGLILNSKGLSRVFFNTTVQKHQFFSAQPSLWSNSRIHTWLLEKPWLRL